jgi:putative effector of murein hydrolase
VKYLTPVVVGSLFIINVTERIKSAYGGYSRIAEFFGGWLVIILFIVVAVMLYKKKEKE